MKNIEFGVKDMECKSCANVIIKKLSELEGVAEVKVDVEGKKVSVDFEHPNLCDSDITCAVEALGYRVHPV